MYTVSEVECYYFLVKEKIVAATLVSLRNWLLHTKEIGKGENRTIQRPRKVISL